MERAAARALAQETLRRCDLLATYSEEPGRLTRTFLSTAMREVQDRVAGWMEGAGMTVRRDGVGNVIGRLGGGPDASGTFLLGSHLDTVPDAGKYDGILGVLLAIAAVEVLGRGGAGGLPCAVEVAGFAEEEGVRFGVPFLGSRAVAGAYDAALLARTDSGGITVAEAIRATGGDPAALLGAGPAYAPGELTGYLEVHIEQGPVLESLGQPLGAVSTIASQCRLRLTFEGRAGHAGTTPMRQRRDALAGAAALVVDVERYARAVPDLVATVGQVQVSPGAANVIPGRVGVSLDVRHPEDETRRRAAARQVRRAGELARRRCLALTVQEELDQPAVACDALLRRRLVEAAQALGYGAPPVVSGAGHDAMVMAALAPVAMLFLRSPGGVSHHPDEAVLADDVAAALEVVVAFLQHLPDLREAAGAPEAPTSPSQADR
jgi:allantoate deiminase